MTIPKITPLTAWHKAHQGRLVDFAGWSMPVQYHSIMAEHEAVRTKVGLFDVSHMGRIEFQGGQSMDLLQQATVNDVSLLADNQIQYSLMCNDLGGTIDDVLVYRVQADRWWMVCNASNRDAVLRRLSQLNPGGAWIKDWTDETAMIAIQGPAALGLVQDRIEPSADQMKYYHFRDFLYQGRSSLLSRTGYTGEDGFEWILPADQAADAWAGLVEAGAVACGLGARDTLRLEAGMPLYGHELSETIDPYSAGLGSFVKPGKGEFAGRMALERIAGNPPRRRVGLILIAANPPGSRVGLNLSGRRPARQGAAVVLDGASVGEVTSGTYSPTLQVPIAMALVNRSIVWPPVEGVLSVDIRGELSGADVCRLPFYRRPNCP
ncbi:MAG: glycine cleavage system aminomethyltransferase GcvT [Planctomycetota bacterium]|nr:glycine cleavage system aminomethyltransferase GcvT [Planctomycetota bacterium]